MLCSFSGSLYKSFDLRLEMPKLMILESKEGYDTALGLKKQTQRKNNRTEYRKFRAVAKNPEQNGKKERFVIFWLLTGKF